MAETKKIIETKRIDRKINIQDIGSNTFTIFQIGTTLAGYLENQ